LVRLKRLLRWCSLPLGLALASIVGCSQSERDEPPIDFNSVPLVPAGGVVTLDKKPLAHAVVSFMPKHGPIAVGETDENGRYSLAYGREGAPVGDYVVAVSYLLSADGEPQGLGPRSRLSAPPGMRTARERLPQTYADLGRSKLRAKVPAQGSTSLNFDLEGPLLAAPEPAPPTKEEPATPAKDETAREPKETAP
jgi:hypothetical protein